jgi:hypothetical protein
MVMTPDPTSSKTSNIVHNERLKLLANALNTAAGSSFTVGVLAPLVAAFYDVSGAYKVAVWKIVVGALIWLSTAVVLHFAARRVLGSLKE